MIIEMITKINDQTNDHITNDHFTATLSMSHYQIGNILLITFNYITFELVLSEKGVKIRE